MAPPEPVVPPELVAKFENQPEYSTSTPVQTEHRSSRQKLPSASLSTSLEGGDSAQQPITRNGIKVDASTSGAQWQSTRLLQTGFDSAELGALALQAEESDFAPSAA